MDLERPEGLFPKIGACGRGNKINRSLELNNLKKKNCRRRRRQRNDALAWLLLQRALVESRAALPARLGREVHMDLFFLQRLDEQTPRWCARFWQYRHCNATSRGQFLARNDRDALVASLRPSPNITHASACKNLSRNRSKIEYLMVDGPILSYDSFGQLSLSCFSMFAPVPSTKNKGVEGNLIKFLLDPFYSQQSQFHSVLTTSTGKWHFYSLRCLILGS